MATVQEIESLLLKSNLANNAVLKKEIQDGVKQELTAFKNDIKEMVKSSLKEATTRIDSLEAKMKEKDQEIEALKAEMSRTNEHTLSLQFDAKKRNFLLFKIQENEVPLTVGVAKLLRDTVDPTFTESDIDSVYRLGAARGSNLPRPIKVELNKASKRNLILSNRRKLQEKNVGIAEDLPKEVSDKRKTVYKLADSLRKNGKKVVFKRDKFIVDGSEWDEDQIENARANLLKRGRSGSDDVADENSLRSRLDLRPPITPGASAHSSLHGGLPSPFSPMNKNLNKQFSYQNNK